MNILNGPEGSTPISDLSGLIPTHLRTKQDLDTWEAENIADANLKYLSKSTALRISIEWFKRLHRDMFGVTWKWAGEFRKEDLNIGVVWHFIPVELKKLSDDINYWSINKGLTAFEQSIRMHHRLVLIHPFKNGNGRHARLASDIFLFNHHEKYPEWPDKNLVETTGIRKQYIYCLKEADSGNYAPLENFTYKLIK